LAGERLMCRARELAERGRYTVAPNPLVGVVVTKNDTLLGEGWHARAGGPHAEVVALGEVGTAARGSTVYVTLEPCNHHGRTPPCTEALIEAGVGRVVIGHLDPDPRMRGRSLDILREAGIEVEVLDDPGFERQNEQYAHYMRTGRPFVHLKLASTLDGRIAASGGDSRWITGEEARYHAHFLRAEAGAVLIGAGTARADDPMLTPRGLPGEPPPVTRVVLDPRLTLGPESKLVRTAGEARVVIFTEESRLDGREHRLLRAGVEVIPAPVRDGVLDLEFVLDELGKRCVRGVLVEGGGFTAARFLGAGLVDKMTVFYAPRVVGSEGVPGIGTLGVRDMKAAVNFLISGSEMVGGDLRVTLYPKEENVYGTG
jgi:diaminohydroxyphosphoribosylaminopyrimidine deaminase/5-amino-6-(5-phosphoribosylamino)uracil reductase